MIEEGDLIEVIVVSFPEWNGIGRVLESGKNVQATMLTGSKIGCTGYFRFSERVKASDEYVRFRRGEEVDYNRIDTGWGNKARVIRDCFVEDSVVDLEGLDTVKKFEMGVGCVRRPVSEEEKKMDSRRVAENKVRELEGDLLEAYNAQEEANRRVSRIIQELKQYRQYVYLSKELNL